MLQRYPATHDGGYMGSAGSTAPTTRLRRQRVRWPSCSTPFSRLLPARALLAVMLLGALLFLQQVGKLHTVWEEFFPRKRRPSLDGVAAGSAQRCFGGKATLPIRSISIIAVCSNRTASLLLVFPSWLAVRGVSEVIVVDWASAEPLRSVLPANLLADPRVRLVRAPAERRWSLSRAYNLAAQLSRGEVLLKVDADTWLHEEMVERQRLPDSGGLFRRGCRDAASDSNAWHLNGVVLIRRADFYAVLGYDERMADYGFDDTDLYERLAQALNLSSACLSFDLMQHRPEAHAHRGLSRLSHIIHRRAVGGLFAPWHMAQTGPSSWEVVRVRAADAAVAVAGGGAPKVAQASAEPPLIVSECQARCKRQPAYFEELMADLEVLQAHRLALQAYSQHAISAAAAASLSNGVDMRTLMRVYEHIGSGGAWVAVRAMNGLASRMRAYCSAAAYAAQSNRRTLLIWEADAQLRARFDELFEPLAEPTLVLHHWWEEAFPESAWLAIDQMGPLRARSARLVSAEESPNRSLLVTSAFRLETKPPLQRARYRSCLASLRPVAAVRHLLLPADGSDGLGSRVGVHIRMLSNASADAPDDGSRAGRPARSLAHLMAQRSACHASLFARTMAEMRDANPSVAFYVAIDSPLELPSLVRQFEPGVVSRLADEHIACGATPARRAAPCARAALADLLNLARTRRLLLSASSAWEEVAVALAPPGTPHDRGCQPTGAAPKLGAPGAAETAPSSTTTGNSPSLASSAAPMAKVRVSAADETSHPMPVGSSNDADTRDARASSMATATQPPAFAAGALSAQASSESSVRSSGQRGDAASPAFYEWRKPEEAGAEEKLFRRDVPGVAVKRVSSLSELTVRPNDVRVLLHKTAALLAVLPPKMAGMQLLFLVPQRFRPTSLVKRMRSLFDLQSWPCVRLYSGPTVGNTTAAKNAAAEESAIKGATLDEWLTLGAHAERYRADDGLLHVVLDTQSTCKRRKGS